MRTIRRRVCRRAASNRCRTEVTSVALLAGSINRVSKSSMVPSFCTIRIIRRVRRSTSTMDWRVAFEARRSVSRSLTNNSRSEIVLTSRTIPQPTSLASAEPTTHPPFSEGACNCSRREIACQQMLSTWGSLRSPADEEVHTSVRWRFVNKYCH